jgi:hypothetical protein
MIIQNKKAQMAAFVITGIILVAMIAAFFLIKKGSSLETGERSETNMKSFFESCLEDKLKQTVKIIIDQGGYLNNSLNISFRFEDNEKLKNISYLCYTSKEFISCTNQEPMLLSHLEKEIERGINEKVRECFDESVKVLQKKEEIVEAKYEGFEVKIFPKKIMVNVEGEIKSTKSEQTIIQNNITGNFQSRLYETTRVVQEIINNEASHCNFDLLEFMMFYPEFKIEKKLTRNSTAIYTVKHKKDIESFNFAIRSCSFPAGF